MSKKTGVSMNGEIEYTRSEKTKKFIRKIDNIKKKTLRYALNVKIIKKDIAKNLKAGVAKLIINVMDMICLIKTGCKKINLITDLKKKKS